MGWNLWRPSATDGCVFLCRKTDAIWTSHTHYQEGEPEPDPVSTGRPPGKNIQMKKTFRYLPLLVSLLGQQNGRAQLDPHFSQYYISPMTLNPALTGVMEGDYRGSVVFRSQYGNTLMTKGLSADMTTNSNYNVGIDLLNESTADQSYAYNVAHLNMAYTGVRFGPNAEHCISMAMQFGLI